MDGPELQLLDRAFALAQPRGGIADTALVHEALDDDVALIARQLVDEPEQTRALLRALHLDVRGGIAARGLVGGPSVDTLARRADRAIDDGVGCNPDQPRAERGAAEFV